MSRRHLFPLAACVVLALGRPCPAFIDVFRPQTLAAVCDRAQSITVVRLEKFSKDKGVFVYRRVKDLKGEFPCDALRERLGEAHLDGERKHYLDWAEAGKTAVVFRYENRLALCIGEQWTVADQGPPVNRDAPYDAATRTEPFFLRSYCGDADKLVPAVTDLLAGKEVVVPCMTGDREKELRERIGRLVRLRTSLKAKDYDPLVSTQVRGTAGSPVRGERG